MAKQKDFEPMPYYRWYWRDWRASRAVQRMPWQARAMYRELLDECWVSGSIPNDADTLANIIGTTRDEFDTFWVHVRPMFTKKGRRLYNARIEHERERANQLRATKSLAGKKSAEKRGDRGPTPVQHPSTDVEHQPTSSSSNSNKHKSSSSAARSTRTRPVAALAPSEARTPGNLTPIGEVDWRPEWLAAGVSAPKIES